MLRTHLLFHGLSVLQVCSVCVVLIGCHPDVPPGSPEAVSGRLVELLHDPSPDIRRSAVESLGKIGRSSHAPTIIRMLDDPDARVREAGAIALGRLQNAAVDQGRFIDALTDSSEAVRGAVARAIGDIGDADALGSPLARSLREGNLPVRRAAVQALIELDAPLAYAALGKAVRDIDAEVRQGAVAAIGEAGVGEAIPLLIDRLLHDDFPGVRAEAAFRLGKIGGESVLREVERAARADHDPIVRRWARWASEELRRPHDSG